MLKLLEDEDDELPVESEEKNGLLWRVVHQRGDLGLNVPFSEQKNTHHKLWLLKWFGYNLTHKIILCCIFVGLQVSIYIDYLLNEQAREIL